jgi:hypothetical protein
MKATVVIAVLLLVAILGAGCSIDMCYSAVEVELGPGRHHRPNHRQHARHGYAPHGHRL